MRIHTGHTAVRCSECGKGCSSSNALQDHQRIHSGMLIRKHLIVWFLTLHCKDFNFKGIIERSQFLTLILVKVR